MSLKMTLKKESIFWIALFLATALPLGVDNVFNRAVSATRINLVMLLLVAGIILNISKLKLMTEKEDKVFFGIVLILGVYFIFGKIKGYNAESDLMTMLLGYLFYLGARLYKQTLYSTAKLASFISKTSLVLVVINMIMYLTESSGFWGVTRILGNKFGGNYFNLLIFSIPVVIYQFYSANRSCSLIRLIITVGMGLFLIIVADFRSILICTVAGIIFTVYLSTKDKSSRFNYSSRIILALLFMLLFGCAVAWFMQSDSSISVRLFGTDLSSTDDSLGTRISTFWYTLKLFFSNILGFGVGYEQPVVNRFGVVVYSEGKFYVDNYFSTMALKEGIFGLLFHAMFFVGIGKKIVKIYKIKGDIFYLLVFWLFVLLLIDGTVISAQLYHSKSMMALVWALSGFVVSDYENLSSNDSSLEII